MTVTLGERSDITGGSFLISNATLSAKGCRFEKTRFLPMKGGRLILDSCVLSGCDLAQRPPEAMATWTNPEDKFTVILRNCVVIAKPSKSPEAAPVIWRVPDPSKGAFQWENCTFMGRSEISFSGGPPGDDFLKEIKNTGSYVRGCVFRHLRADAMLVALSDRCWFDDVSFSAEASELKTPFRVTARVQPEDQLALLKRFSPQMSIDTPETDIGGSSIKNDGQYAAELSVMTGTKVFTDTVFPSASPTSLPTTVFYNPAARGPAPVTGTPGANDVPLKASQASIHGLLIVSLDRGEAGSASKMSVIALEHDKEAASEVTFNQQVGDMMSKALVEVSKFTQLRHKGWPKGYKIELSFADKYSNKDGPSAAVACALLLNSLITGKQNDPAFAVTGDMNADGTVQPIGGVAAKIRGATGGKCKLVAIPEKNEKSLGDLLLTDGPAPFAGIQIYSISHFDEAEALALTERSPQVQSAIDQMQQVQDVLLRNRAQMGAWLKNPHVIAKLQAVLQAAPNHLSAKYLLMYGMGKAPTALSLAGSIDAVEKAAAELIAAIKANKGQDTNALRKDVVGSSITRLQVLRAKCDARVRPYTDAIVKYGSIIKDAQDRPANSASRYNQIMSSLRVSVDAVQSEWNNLIKNPQVVEELEQ